MFKFNKQVVAVVGAALIGLLALGMEGWTQRGPGGGPGGPGGTPMLSAAQIKAGLGLLAQSDPTAQLLNAVTVKGTKSNSDNVLAQNVTGNPYVALRRNKIHNNGQMERLLAQGQGEPLPIGVMQVRAKINNNGQAMRNKISNNGQIFTGSRLNPDTSYGITMGSVKKSGNGSAQTDQAGGQAGNLVVLIITQLNDKGDAVLDIAEIFVQAEVVTKALSDEFLSQQGIDSSLLDEYAPTVLLNLVACFLEDSQGSPCEQ